jgi:hypothetical protein
VRPAAGGAPGTIVFAVADTGVGIPPSQLGRIFEDFTQADASTTRSFGGTGLGLALSRRLAVLMGGELTVESEVGAGSIFTLTAPFEVVSAPPRGRELKDLHRHRVLVVDDDPTNRLVLREALSAWGIRSRDFESPSAALSGLALAKADGRPYSLVPVDNQMPEL